jgi:hypothetical protein
LQIEDAMVSFSNTLPFSSRETSYSGTQYLGVQDIGRMMQVCKEWCAWGNRELVVWKNASLNDKIPIVDGQDRNYKED